MGSNSRIRILRHAAAERQEWQCYYCSFPMWEGDPEVFKTRYSVSSREVRRFRCTAEHLTAQFDGGRDIEENIVVACHYCNRTRHRRKRPKDAESYASFFSIQDRKRTMASCLVKAVKSASEVSR
ncbi:HNH endonuclease [Rhizobium leguminosarum]